MKVQITEHDKCFGIDLTAETMAEAATLVRLGVNRTGEIRHFSVHANRDGSFDSMIVVAKHRRADSTIQKRK